MTTAKIGKPVKSPSDTCRESTTRGDPQRSPRWQPVGENVWELPGDYPQRLICADVRTTDAVSDESIDLVVSSPPYNVGISYNSHNDGMPYDDYLAFVEQALIRCYQWVKPGGRLCLNVPLDTSPKMGCQSVYADMTQIAKAAGWTYRTTIDWNEGNISKNIAVGTPQSASAPHVISTTEMILVMYKGEWSLGRHHEQSIPAADFYALTRAPWCFPGESSKQIGHPAPFPIELPRRCLKLFSFAGDQILDPFAGSGSTLIACAQMGRKGIGIDIDEEYCQLAQRRIVAETKGELTQCPQ